MTNNFKINNKPFKSFPNHIEIMCDGYFLPRNDYFNNLSNRHDEDLIHELFIKFGIDFIKQIKGNFYIIIKQDKKTFVYTDHLGLKKLYYKIDENQITFSNTVEQLIEKNHLKLDQTTLAIKALLNREIASDTIFENIKVTTAASEIILENEKISFTNYWSPQQLIGDVDKKFDIKFFENLIKNNIKNINQYFKPEDYSITLTGGKDSRTGLCALLNLGIKPIGLTYGSKDSKDAVFAKKVADAAKINHHVFDMPKDEKSIEAIINQIIDINNPLINIHRAHRFFAFKQLENMSSKNQVYLAGYMAGELLMGVYYDDTVFPQMVTQFWEDKAELDEEKIKSKLTSYFIKNIDHTADILKRFKQLQTLNPKLNLFESQLHGIFELGIPHHSQDIFLSSTVLKYPYPFFLDIDFIEALFKSKFSFRYTNNKTKNLLARYKLYYFNLKLQHSLYPALSRVPFAKKGNYTTIDYLSGHLYWSFIKVINYFKEKNKYSPPFKYNQNYYNFATQQLTAINEDQHHAIHQFFNVNEALIELKQAKNLTQEKQWFKYTNIISTYKYFNAIN